MKTRYFLTNIISNDRLELDLVRFESLKTSRMKLKEALYLEEKYDIFLSNYVVIEKEILINTIDRYFLRSESYNFFQESRLNMNRLFINFLSSVRMYRDQMPSHVGNCLYNDRDAFNNSKNLFSKEYDSSIEYQFMEALRNHSQHGGHAVHSISFQARNVAHGVSAKNQFSISIWALKSTLMENSKFPKKRLSSVDEKIDLIRFSRKYIQSLNIIHTQMREMISPAIDEARNSIESIQADFIKTTNATLGNMYLVSTDEIGDDIKEKIPLLLHYDDERIALIRKNQQLTNLSMASFESTSYSS